MIGTLLVWGAVLALPVAHATPNATEPPASLLRRLRLRFGARVK